MTSLMIYVNLYNVHKCTSINPSSRNATPWSGIPELSLGSVGSWKLVLSFVLQSPPLVH